MKPATENRRITIEELKALHHQRAAEIRARLADFAAVPPAEYFYELLYCLMTPQSSAVNAGKVVDALRAEEFRERGFDPAPLLGDRGHYIRFHRTKARRLLEARDGFEAVSARLSDGTTPPETREWLVANVKGLGMKEASHFLRNIGRRDLAILDRHILRNLVAVGALRSLPKGLTPKGYLALEKRFAAFAARVGIPMDELDLLFWSFGTGKILK